MGRGDQVEAPAVGTALRRTFKAAEEKTAGQTGLEKGRRLSWPSSSSSSSRRCAEHACPGPGRRADQQSTAGDGFQWRTAMPIGVGLLGKRLVASIQRQKAPAVASPIVVHVLVARYAGTCRSIAKLSEQQRCPRLGLFGVGRAFRWRAIHCIAIRRGLASRWGASDAGFFRALGRRAAAFLADGAAATAALGDTA